MSADIQKCKVILSSFNPADWEYESAGALNPPTLTQLQALDLQGAVNNGAGYAAGTSTITVDGFTGAPSSSYSTVVKFANHDRCYKGSFSTSTQIILTPALDEAVIDNEVIYIMPMIDITDYLISIPKISMQREERQNKALIDKSLSWMLANWGDEFYDRLTHTTSFDITKAFFTTYGAQGLQNFAYVQLQIKRNDVWYPKYNGKIDPKTISINEALKKKTISFYSKSGWWDLKNIRFGDVADIKNGHGYTSSSVNTKTISGLNWHIIGKIALETGLKKTGYTVVRKERTSNVVTLDITTSTNFLQVGELIEVSSSVDSSLAGKHVVSSFGTHVGTTLQVKFNLTGSNIASSAISVAGGLVSHKTVFDNGSDYFDITHQGWDYDFFDTWFICPKWLRGDVENENCDSIMAMYYGWFCAGAQIDFYKGISKFYFKAKNSTKSSLATLSDESFIGDDWNLNALFQSKSSNGVECNASVRYFNEEENESARNYNSNVFGVVYQATNKNASQFRFVVNAYDDTSTITNLVGSKIKFEHHDTVYEVLSYTGSGQLYNIRPNLTKAIKANEYFWQVTGDNLTIKYPECFSFRLKYPDIYVIDDTNDDLIKLYNNNSSGSITNYTDVAIFSSGSNVNGVCHAELLPIDSNRQGASGAITGQSREVPCGLNLFLADDDDIRNFGNSQGEAQDQNGGGVLSNYSSGVLRQITAGYIEIDEDTDFTTKDIKTRLFVYQAVDDTPTSNDLLRRTEIKLENEGDYWQDNVAGDNAFYRLQVEESKIKLDIGDTGAPAAVSIYGCFLNTSVLNPYYDDKVYFTDTDAAYGTASMRHVKRMLSYGARTISGAFSSGSPIAGANSPRQCMVYMGTTASGQKIIWADTNNDRIYEGSIDSAWPSSSVAGGGGTSPTLGNSTSSANLSLSNPEGVWACYDWNGNTTKVVIADTGNDKVLIGDGSGSYYCIADSTVLNDPKQVAVVDFVNVFATNSSGGLTVYYSDITLNASKKQFDFYSADRRQINAMLMDSHLSNLDYTIGDIFTMDTTVVSKPSGSATEFYVEAYEFDPVTHDHYIEFLEKGGV